MIAIEDTSHRTKIRCFLAAPEAPLDPKRYSAVRVIRA
jgi:hypothetical protein